MSEDGIVMVTLVMNEGFLSQEPFITMKGFVGCGNPQTRALIKENILQRFERVNNGQASRNEISSAIKKSLRTLFEKNLQRDPIVEVQIIEM
jgi:mRNA degradation ribonuclease J1/J2